MEEFYYKPKCAGVKIEDTLDLSVYSEWESKIDNDSSLSDNEKYILKLLATRWIDFKYEKLADLYAISSSNIKNYLEDLRLVIIDTNRAIEKGLFKYFESYDKLIEGITDEK